MVTDKHPEPDSEKPPRTKYLTHSERGPAGRPVRAACGRRSAAGTLPPAHHGGAEARSGYLPDRPSEPTGPRAPPTAPPREVGVRSPCTRAAPPIVMSSHIARSPKPPSSSRSGPVRARSTISCTSAPGARRSAPTTAATSRSDPRRPGDPQATGRSSRRLLRPRHEDLPRGQRVRDEAGARLVAAPTRSPGPPHPGHLRERPSHAFAPNRRSTWYPSWRKTRSGTPPGRWWAGFGPFEPDQRPGLHGGPEIGGITGSEVPSEASSMARACAGLDGVAGSLPVHMAGITPGRQGRETGKVSERAGQ